MGLNYNIGLMAGAKERAQDTLTFTRPFLF
jgi:hypothetical protein